MFNVERFEDAPPSLLKQSKYDGQDVWDALVSIFYNKCYLCETNELHDINIEHFKPHKGDKALKFSWKNLYYACGRCNNIKLARYENILDCCNPSDDVFRSIKCLPPVMPGSSRLSIVAMSDDARVIETCDLLNEIYNNESTVNKTITGKSLRRKVFAKYSEVLRWVNSYYDGGATDEEKRYAIERIGVLIRRDQPFSAFSRWIILSDDELSSKFDASMD